MMLQLKEVLARAVSDLNLIKPLHHCAPTASVEEVTKMLQTSLGGSILVLDGKKLMGIFTERDVLKKVTLSTANLKTTPISAMMTPNPVSVKLHTPVAEVLEKMRSGKFRHLVVTDAYGNAQGVVSMRDVMDYISNLLVGGAK